MCSLDIVAFVVVALRIVVVVVAFGVPVVVVIVVVVVAPLVVLLVVVGCINQLSVVVETEFAFVVLSFLLAVSPQQRPLLRAAWLWK